MASWHGSYTDLVAKPAEGIQLAKESLKQGNDKLYYGLCKIMTEGSIQGFSGRLKWPGYLNGAPNGSWNFPPEQLTEMVQAYHAAGLQLKNINHHAPVLVERIDSLPLELVLNCSKARLLQTHPQSRQNQHKHEIHLFQTVALRSDEMVDYDAFESFINSLPPTTLRGKGRLVMTTGRYLWHRVGRRSELTKTTLEFSSSEVVVIGRADMEAVGRAALDYGFMACN